jgi:dihydrofolate reductase
MISLIAAYNNNKVIGKDGKIPWHCSADLKRFKELTMGCPVIMGRKTWESIGKPLPGRKNIVVSKGNGLYPKEVEVVPSFKSAIIGVQETYYCEEIFIIGGEEIYRQAIPMADTMYLTHINDDSDGDAFFPEFDPEEWDVNLGDSCPEYTFRILERRTK